jgi:hypothetical protein
MRKLFKISAFVLLTLNFLGCSSDSSDDPCVPITCLNNGVSNSDCGCDCPQGYSGTNCSLEITPTKIKITKIRIKQFSNLNLDGFLWDGTNRADIYIKLYKPTTNLIFTSSFYTANANGDGTSFYDEVFNPQIESTLSSSIFKMELIDYDGDDFLDTNGDDLMHTATFSTYVETQGSNFPNSFEIKDSSQQLTVEVFVTYEF